jgi:hypothetical protein
MGIRVSSPRPELLERALRMVRNIGPDARLGAESLRQFVLRLHRDVEVVEPLFRDDIVSGR